MDLQKYEYFTEMIVAKLNRLGRNKVELANEVDVDPSTLNRNLSGETVAPYPRLKAIWDVLKRWENKQTQPAEELMITEFDSTYLSESRRDAAEKMIKNDYSQLPVREDDGGEIVGIVTDADLMKVHDDEKAISEIDYHHLIRVEAKTSRQLVEDILAEGHSAVLVVEDGTSVGFITKYDLLKQGPNLRPTENSEAEGDRSYK
jgi:predicted transcriptional regulator